MKKITAFLISLAFCITAIAQEKDFQTLFGNNNGPISHGAYGALTFGYTQIDDKDAMMFGIKGGWIIDHHVTIGLAGNAFVNDFT